jgi:hypothetical protein
MKRSISIAFCAILLISLFCGPAKAATYSSEYLRYYNASLSTGKYSGELSLNFDAYARDSMTSIGVSRIDVYSSDGSFVKSVNGSTSNGLLASGTSIHSGTHTIKVSSGQRYYLEVTFIAKNSLGSDSKWTTTNTATAR